MHCVYNKQIQFMTAPRLNGAIILHQQNNPKHFYWQRLQKNREVKSDLWIIYLTYDLWSFNK